MKLASILATEAWVFLGLAIALVVVKLLAGSINTRYLLYGRDDRGRLYFSPERVQLLILTLATAAEYLSLVADTAGSGTLPEVPTTWLGVVGTSQSIYLGGKAYAMVPWQRLLTNFFRGGPR